MVPPLQNQLVLPGFSSLGGMPHDVKWVTLAAFSLQDRELVSYWVHDSASNVNITLARIAILGRDVGSWCVRDHMHRGNDAELHVGVIVQLGLCRGATGAQLVQQSESMQYLIGSVCLGFGLASIQHFQFVGAFPITRHGGDVGALRTACRSRCQFVSLCFIHLVAVRFAGAWQAREERTQGAGSLRTKSAGAVVRAARAEMQQVATLPSTTSEKMKHYSVLKQRRLRHAQQKRPKTKKIHVRKRRHDWKTIRPKTKSRHVRKRRYGGNGKGQEADMSRKGRDGGNDKGPTADMSGKVKTGWKRQKAKRLEKRRGRKY